MAYMLYTCRSYTHVVHISCTLLKRRFFNNLLYTFEESQCNMYSRIKRKIVYRVGGTRTRDIRLTPTGDFVPQGEALRTSATLLHVCSCVKFHFKKQTTKTDALRHRIQCGRNDYRKTSV